MIKNKIVIDLEKYDEFMLCFEKRKELAPHSIYTKKFDFQDDTIIFENDFCIENLQNDIANNHLINKTLLNDLLLIKNMSTKEFVKWQNSLNNQ